MQQTTTLRNIGGQHAMADGTMVGSNETFVYECDVDALLKTFPGKFVREQTSAEPVQAEESAQVSAEPVKSAEVPKPDTVDVTADFPGAAGNGLRVIRDKRGWWVYDEDDGSSDPVNETALKKKEAWGIVDEYASA